MDLDPVILSRLQFAWVIGWHILMPAFTVGMASYIAILEGYLFATARKSICGPRCSGSASSRWPSASGWCPA